MAARIFLVCISEPESLRAGAALRRCTRAARFYRSSRDRLLAFLQIAAHGFHIVGIADARSGLETAITMSYVITFCTLIGAWRICALFREKSVRDTRPR